MKTYLLIISMLVGFTLSAQTYHPFPSKNTLWTELANIPDPDGYNGFHCFALKDKDTTINGKLYHKLYHSTDTLFTESKLCGGIREANKRIYFYAIDSIIGNDFYRFPSKKKEIILYDFSLKAGDTICQADSFHIMIECMSVVKVDSILTAAGYRKRISFGNIAGRPYQRAQWVEGIGSIKGLLFVTGETPTGCPYNDLLCVRQEKNWIFHSDRGSCFGMFNAIDKITSNNVSLSPNPVEAVFKITFPLGNTRIQIVNMYGIVVRAFDIAGLTSTTINREGLPSGIYLVNLTDGNKKYSTVKVVFK